MKRIMMALAGLAAVGCLGIASAQAAFSRAGWSATIVPHENGLNLAGTVTIVDANTLNLTGFSYNGDGAGDVRVTLGTTDSDLDFFNGPNLGSNLYGTNFVNQDILGIDVPGGLDGFDAVSIYCVDAHVNFGSGTFAAPVPEPASLLLLAGGMPLLLWRRRRA